MHVDAGISAHARVRTSSCYQSAGIRFRLNDRHVSFDGHFQNSLGWALVRYGTGADVAELIGLGSELSGRRNHHEIVCIKPRERSSIPGA